jgi:hypothetical protein
LHIRILYSMLIKKHLNPGQLAVSTFDDDQLVLWSSLECSIDEPHGVAYRDDVLLILEFSELVPKLGNSTSEEWIQGAYHVLASSGQSGWIGEGFAAAII